jgi:hypothetical protein
VLLLYVLLLGIWLLLLYRSLRVCLLLPEYPLLLEYKMPQECSPLLV